ncbi:MAG: type II toxin-antitoxin system prevent-host-death family antitoxin [Thermomicrobiales bacterium]|nr:type II toxin-antitoxin system prevent-host-death family antitoxin [Thermomicrobiales bacterium]
MRTVGAFEAKTHLSKLLDDVESGETILIARHGRVIARLSPAEQPGRRAVANLIRSWEAYRDSEGINLDGLTIDELLAESRSE